MTNCSPVVEFDTDVGQEIEGADFDAIADEGEDDQGGGGGVVE